MAQLDEGKACFVLVLVFGQMAEWLKATDCKSVLFGVRRFESFSAHLERVKMWVMWKSGDGSIVLVSSLLFWKA